MACLRLSLLGSFETKLDGEPLTGFPTAKTQALLAYLAVEAHRAHRREVLAALLWPDWPERAARTNLRNALSKLRTAIGDRRANGVRDPYLLVTRETLQFNAASDHWLDVAVFRGLVAVRDQVATDRRDDAANDRLQQAIAVYRGPFLEGFTVSDSRAFEDWAFLVRERLQRQALEALQRLVGHYEGRGEVARASELAWRWVELAPWQEQAHRALMRCLALSGQRSAGLAQYEACRRALKEELDVEPGEETTRLYERIRDGELTPAPQVAQVQESTPRMVPTSPISADAEPSISVQPDSPSRSPGMEWRKEGLQGERRTITALVIRVRGTTEWEEPVDVETWVEVMNGFLPILEAATSRYGGRVDRHRDDGLVVLFGASAAHEDDPERAVLAALAIREAIQPELAELAHREQIELVLHAGIHTGEMVVTGVGDRTHVWAAPVIDGADALTQQTDRCSEPCTLSVAEGTWRLVAPLFEWQTLGEVEVENQRPPIVAYRPLRHKAGLGKGRGIQGLSSPLVGRDAETYALQNAIAGLRDGIGGIVTVVGEAGIGKSRLVAEIRKSAHLKSPNLQWVEGRCLSYATNVAYQLWQDVLHSWLDVAPEASPHAVRDRLQERVQALCRDGFDQVYPYLGRLLSLPLEDQIEDELRGLDGQSLQFITFRAVETLLGRAAQQRALAVVCEDLHWADVTSLALLERLLALTDRVPLLLVCVFRPERVHGCWRIVEAAARDYAHGHTGLQLEPLSHSEGAALVDNLLQVEELHPELAEGPFVLSEGEGLPRALRARILEHAEGNPLYVEEILRSLIDGGIIVYDPSSDQWQATQDVDELPIPDTLQGVLRARIDRLPGETKRVLQVASVIGRIFVYPVLEAIAPAPPPLPGAGEGRETLNAQLIALQRAQLIRQRKRVPEREYAFKHVLTQEAAYNGLLGRERRATHRQVAEALERLYPESVEGLLGLLAYHWERAGENERAVETLRRAGEQAAAQFANAEAADHFTRALDLVPEDDVAERYVLLLARERVYDLQGLREVQHQDLAALEKLTEALADPRRQAEVAVRRTHYAYVMADYPAAVAAAQVAIHLAQKARDAEIQVAGHLHHGQALDGLGDDDAARLQYQRALSLARTAGLHREEASSLNYLGDTLFAQRDLAGAEVHFQQALRTCRELGDRAGECKALAGLSHILGARGDHDAARECRETTLRIHRQLGDRRSEGHNLFYLGFISFRLGDYTRAKGNYEQSLPIFREIDDRLGEGRVLFNLGGVLGRLGDYSGAGPFLEQGLGIFHELGHKPGERLGAGYLCLLYHHLGDDETALEYGRQAAQIGPDVGGPDYWCLVLTFLGHAQAGMGHLAEAANTYRQALAMRRKLNQPCPAAEVLAGLARVSLALGDIRQAQAQVEEILGCLQAYPLLSLELVEELFRVHLTCYRVLRAVDDPRAIEILETAYWLLQERARKIDDEELRHSYLENVAAHREIVAAWEDMSRP